MEVNNYSQKPSSSQKPGLRPLVLFLTLVLTAQLQAQSPSCTLTLTTSITDIQCNDNGTSDPNDDTFTFTLTVNGGNPWGWMGGGVAMADYGVPVSFGPFLISGGPVSFTVVDMDNPTCTADVTVNPPDPCSPGPALPGAIGDFVWSDDNSNGIQDAGETGIGGVFVILHDASMAVLDFVITADDGSYLFSNVQPGTYKIKFANPGGVEPSPKDAGDDSTDSDQDLLGFTDFFTIGDSETNLTVDAGFMPIPQPSCDIEIDVISVDCADDGTFTFTAIITGGNPWGWSGGGIAMGDYDVPYTFGPFPISGGAVTITITDMDNPTCIESVTVEPCEPVICINPSDAGVIGNDESRCGPYDPEEIVELVPPTGGTGTLQYMWLKSFDGCPGNMSQRIPGANGPTYDPGEILQTTWFRRCVRMDDCPWMDGECVVKEVTNDCPTGSCETRAVSDASFCEDGEEFVVMTNDFLTGTADQSDLWHLKYASMIEQLNGSARLQAKVINNDNVNLAFELDITFFLRDSPGSPTLSDCYAIDDSDWYYYGSASGTLTGTRALAGGVVSLSSTGWVQLGTGANLHQFSQFGTSTSFNLNVVSQPDFDLHFIETGDMSLHLQLSGYQPNCPGSLVGEEADNRSENGRKIEQTSKDFQILPNPASEVLQIDLANYLDDDVQISFINAFGVEVKQQQIRQVESTTYPLNITDLPSGHYFVRVTTAGSKGIIKRLVKVN